jgi:hypothetical protein
VDEEKNAEDPVNSRRGFLKFLGVSSAGIAVVGAAQAVKEKTKDGIEVTRAEIDKLKEDYERLDRKTQLILRVMLALSGLDIFLSL